MKFKIQDSTPMSYSLKYAPKLEEIFGKRPRNESLTHNETHLSWAKNEITIVLINII